MKNWTVEEIEKLMEGLSRINISIAANQLPPKYGRFLDAAPVIISSLLTQLREARQETAQTCIDIVRAYDIENDAEATLCGYVFANSVINKIRQKFGGE